MRFMMLMIPKGYEKAQPGAMPDAKAVAAMMKYNESLQKAGVLLALMACTRHRWERESHSLEGSPGSENEVIEIRQVQEFTDFPADVQKAAAGFPEMQGQAKQKKGS